jgi:acetyl-CoA acetyltransferase
MGLNRDVYVIGVGMSAFGRYSGNSGDLGFQAGVAALDDAAIPFTDVQYVSVGADFLGGGSGVDVIKDLGLTGVPITNVFNASATGSTAFREAVLSVAGGHSEVAMALGFSNMLATNSVQAAPPAPKMEWVVLPAGFFALWAVRRMHDYGTTVETFAKIAAKNWNHARLNPYAQRRADHLITPEEVLASRMISYPHTSMMSTASGAGGACAIVATREVAERLANSRPLVKVVASQQQSEQYTEGHIFHGAVVGPPEMTQTTAQACYEEAGLGPSDLSLVHVHDAFPIEELMYYELLGICPEGEGDRLVAEGATSLGGRIPFSTDGGLIARGHPGSPTGLAQIWDVATQLRGEAGPRQVENARVGLAHMVGAGTVCVTHILQRA